MTRSTTTNRRTFVAALAATAALLVPAALHASPSSAQVAPEISASATEGLPSETFEVTGTGCENGFITHRVDDGTTEGAFLQVDDTGTWVDTVAFPEPTGVHSLTFDCSDQSTDGAPTTILGPGELRFSYDPIQVTTLEEAPTTEPVIVCEGGGDGGGDSTDGSGGDGTVETVIVDPAPEGPRVEDTVETTDTVDTTEPTETTDTTEITGTTEPGLVQCYGEALPASAEDGTATYTG